MKKSLFCILNFITMLFMITLCFAGDVPESLLSDDNAQVYFGEVKSVDGDSVTLIKRQNIKGEFVQDEEVTYASFVFSATLEVGEKYLCGFLNEDNPLYLLEVSGYDTRTLKVINANDMMQRMQEYLNDGKFEEKEQERLLALEQVKESEQEAEVTVIDSETNKKTGNLPGIITVCIAIFVISIMILLKKFYNIMIRGGKHV